jgi:hypothetical protein
MIALRFRWTSFAASGGDNRSLMALITAQSKKAAPAESSQSNPQKVEGISFID